ncbi:hypothetical protein GGR21_001203 [Dysgonomonas hofstadii]|uniref:Uncharacterized protein n=1 Tax=Dysgonomonas hofstadii TaxID=637886 RepID=A0A840CP58_9BACT|nr:hypothetical protein [Dysgonomonas hofstadii]MBB4035314.1 hypothetical protein [Dysgonomonas hofstadii]
MKKNTLKGKTKMLSYMIAFIIMMGVHLVMDRTGTKKEYVDNDQNTKTHSDEIDNGIAQVDYLLSDSLPAGGESNKKVNPLKNEYSN